MTVETKLALSAQEVRSFSESNNEPASFTDFRVSALEKAAQLECQNQIKQILQNGTSLISQYIL